MEHPEKKIKAIADKIRKIRGGLSRKEFGKIIGESESSIQNYEKGQYKRKHTIPVDVLIKISIKFHVPLRDLVDPE